MITENETILFQNVVLTCGLQIFIDLQKFKCYILFYFPVKAKRFEIHLRGPLRSVEKTDL